jgi:hypothetical protein
MAGHNKWSKVKRQKAVTDARKGKVFSRLSRDITLAARAGGGDPEGNARLRTLLLKAREANMPADNIDRAIKKGPASPTRSSPTKATVPAASPSSFKSRPTTKTAPRPRCAPCSPSMAAILPVAAP